MLPVPRKPQPEPEVPSGIFQSDLAQSEEMKAVANDLLRGYLALTERGYHPRTVALAMMGATVNLFDALDLNDELVPLLRAIAYRVEQGDLGRSGEGSFREG